MISNNKSVQILEEARKGKYGIAAVIVYDAVGVVATIKAAEERKSPAMLLCFPWLFHWGGRQFIQYMADAAKNAKVPISLHLDHCQSEDDVKLAMDMPFDSIMVDMSHFELEDNLQKTAYYTKLCHERGIATEGETGRIQGSESGVPDTVDLEGLLTSPEFAKEFATKTNVDFLAPSFGNFHGTYPIKADGSRDIHLDFPRLQSIMAAVPNCEIALHGTNDWPDHLMRKTIEMGCTKLNVNKNTMIQYTEFINENTGKMDYTTLMDKGLEIFTKSIADCMDLCGSTGKAK